LHDTILTLVRTLTGASDGEAALLELLCTAAEQAWTDRLRQGVTPEGCGGAYPCACAFTAAAGLLTGRAGRDAGAAFRAGDLSVTADAAGASDAARALLEQAERLMAPFAAADGFLFCGVRA